MFGKPVIAYAKGGVLETVIPANGKEKKTDQTLTGIFFYEQTAESLSAAIREFDSVKFDSEAIREHAKKFETERFKSEILSFLNRITERQVHVGKN